ncbi:MAG: DegT/DnrJ/EryC1/StrS family aminotransferase [Verrucomicrobiota bacterium]
MKVDFYRHSLGQEDVASTIEAMKQTMLSRGDTVYEFQRKLAEYTENSYCVGLMSCTAALEFALILLGIEKGDEVITTPLTFVATANVILHRGATPVFVDVEAETGNIDATRIEKAITPRTKAILPVHLYGLMCDMKAIRKIADHHHLTIIEDAAHCVEGIRDGVKPGQLSDAACFSFYATKNITSGEGGALVLKDEELANRASCLALHGMDKSADKRMQGKFTHWDMNEPGYKANMSNIQAAMLLPQLKRIEIMLARREALGRRYEEAFSKIQGISMQKIPANCRSARHLFTIWVNPKIRDRCIELLQDAGIGVTVNYRPVHLLHYFRKQSSYASGMYPCAERIGNSTLSLPLYPSLKNDEIEYVIQSVTKIIRQLS